jgi:hypothetical protein
LLATGKNLHTPKLKIRLRYSPMRRTVIAVALFGFFSSSVHANEHIEGLFREMGACTRGYSFAHQTASPDPFSESAISDAVLSAGVVCKSDELVAALYTASSDGAPFKSLAEAEKFVLDGIEKQVRANLALFEKARSGRVDSN